jgi:site-specific DNA recombinase
MTNVIHYIRVSTDEQAEKGYSLAHQESVLSKFSEVKDFKVLRTFTEDYSAKTFERPQWTKILAFIKANKGLVQKIVFLRWDRFSRNQLDALTMIKYLDKLGIKVESVEQPLDLSIPDNKMLLALYLTAPEIENDKNSIRTTEASRRAKLEGCWMGTAPKGYSNFRDGKNSTLIRNEKAPLIIESFERMASGAYSADEVRKWLYSKGVKMTKNNFPIIIRNQVYIGKIHVKEYKDNPEVYAKGLHEPLISEELFYRANDVLDGRRRNMKFGLDKTDMYPLKGILKCPVHPQRSLTAYASTGRSGSKHHYYLCPKCDKTQRHRIGDVHNSIEDILKSIQFSAESIKLYHALLEKVMSREEINKANDLSKLQKDIDRIQTRQGNLLNTFLDGEIDSKSYNEIKFKLDVELVSLNDKLANIKENGSLFKSYVKKHIPMLENLVSYYRNANGTTKFKILSCIFEEKLIVENGRVATTPFAEPIRVLFDLNEVLKESKNKKEVDYDLFLITAPSPGLEPGTP